MGSVFYQSIRLTYIYTIFYFKIILHSTQINFWSSSTCLQLFQGSEDKECQGIFINPSNKFKNLRTEKLCNFTDQEYVHWMTYWIVLAVVSVGEEVTDIVLAPWFPFYYELKIVFLLWLISPVSRYLHP